MPSTATSSMPSASTADVSPPRCAGVRCRESTEVIARSAVRESCLARFVRGAPVVVSPGVEPPGMDLIVKESRESVARPHFVGLSAYAAVRRGTPQRCAGVRRCEWSEVIAGSVFRGSGRSRFVRGAPGNGRRERFRSSRVGQARSRPRPSRRLIGVRCGAPWCAAVVRRRALMRVDGNRFPVGRWRIGLLSFRPRCARRGALVKRLLEWIQLSKNA